MPKLRLYQRSCVRGALLALTVAAGSLGAQESVNVGEVSAAATIEAHGPTVRSARVLSREHVPTPPQRSLPAPVQWTDARRLGLFAAAAGLVMPIDRDAQRVMQRSWVQQSALIRNTADLFNAYGSPGVFVASAALYGAGWATKDVETSRLGLRSIEAIGVSGVVTGALKGLAGRARPYASPGNPHDWVLMSGTHDGARQSFPSGHTTAVFAFATAVHQELRVRHPSTARWAGPALYTAAALTGLARMHSDNHWASDVVMGAGVGTVTGLVIARFHADRPHHWIDERLLPRRGE